MNSPPVPDSAGRPQLGVIIRFKNSAATLPGVLAALRSQTRPPDFILGVDSGSQDDSPRLLQSAGARLVSWSAPYNHPRVLNFALQHCPAELVLVLSSHTVLQSPQALAELCSALADPRVACASCQWDDDPFYSPAVTWAEVRAKGLKFGSLYSNSMGLLRRSCWAAHPFDESLVGMEDGAWALEQLKLGYVCRRLAIPFSYQRSGSTRDYFFAVLTFQMAARHGLRVAWLGVNGSVRDWLRTLARRLTGRPVDLAAAKARRERLRAWLTWRFVRLDKE